MYFGWNMRRNATESLLLQSAYGLAGIAGPGFNNAQRVS